MNEELTFVESARSTGRRIAEPDHAEELVHGGIDHRNHVRNYLVHRVNAIAVGDRNVCSPRRLLRKCGRRQEKNDRAQTSFIFILLLILMLSASVCLSPASPSLIPVLAAASGRVASAEFKIADR